MKYIKAIFIFTLLTILTGCTLEGEIGPQGDQGLTGETGMDGQDGLDGRDGLDGLSTFELWLTQAGNEDKTLEEFLEILQGPDLSIIDELEDKLIELELMNDVLELKLWLMEVPQTFTSGVMFPYMDIPILSYESIVTNANHTFDYSSDNGTFTITISHEGYIYDLELSYIIVMNQTEIDTVNLQKATEDATQLQSWLDSLNDDFITGESLPTLPLLNNNSTVTGYQGLIFNHNPQNGNVVLTVNYGGQTATAERVFLIGANDQLLLNQDAQILQQWLYSLDEEVNHGDQLPQIPNLPNGSAVTGLNHEFNYSTQNGEVVLTITNGTAQTVITRTFIINLF